MSFYNYYKNLSKQTFKKVNKYIYFVKVNGFFYELVVASVVVVVVVPGDESESEEPKKNSKIR